MSEILNDPSSDAVLELLIIAAENGATAPITLNVGGWLISGYIISHDDYMKEFLHGELQKRIDDARELLKAEGTLEDEPNEDEELSRPPRFIPVLPAGI